MLLCTAHGGKDLPALAHGSFPRKQSGCVGIEEVGTVPRSSRTQGSARCRAKTSPNCDPQVPGPERRGGNEGQPLSLASLGSVSTDLHQ